MDRLPEELTLYLFDFFQPASALSAAMLACKEWYLRGARNLHANIVLNLVPGLTVSSCDIVMSFMKRLTSPLSTAHCIHHLTLTGFATMDVQELILSILDRATALRSLNMHNLKLLQGGMLLPPDVYSSPDFMQNLSALYTISAPFAVSLSLTRPLQAIKVQEPMNDALLRRLLSSKSGLTRRVRSLELALCVDSPAAAVALMASLASALAEAPLHALALQFVLDRPRQVLWTEFAHAVEEMGLSLQSLRGLRSLSLVLRPDPLIPATADGQSGSGDDHREMVTQCLAEKLIRDNALTCLTRIELRWHGWVVQDGKLVQLPRTELLRLPHRWVFADSAGERL